MANANLTHLMQDLGAGDTLALALKQYEGMVLAAFPMATVFYENTWIKQITAGKSHQFPAIWKMTEAEHTAGTELEGQEEPLVEERIINVDPKQRTAQVYLDEYDDFIAHFDQRQQIAFEATKSLATICDTHVARMIALGARQAARGPTSEFPAGNTLTTPRTGPVTTAYPLSLAGSIALQDDLGEIGQKMDEKNVLKGGRVAYITPYLSRVLLQDNTLVSTEYMTPNNKFTRSAKLVQGFNIEESNNVPNSNVTTGTAAYQGDFSKTIALCTGDYTAVGTVAFGGVRPFGPSWIEDKLSWLIGARKLKGNKWLRPEACGEIAIA